MTQNASAGDGRGAKAEAAKQEAVQTGQQVSQAGGQLAHSVAAQGRDVANEAGRQARGLMGQASSQLKEQAIAQQHRAADGLRTLGDQLQAMSDRTEQPGMANDLVRQAAERARRAADWLNQREPGTVVNEVRDYARRNPGLFLAGAAVAGMLAGRLGKGAKSAQDGGGMPHRGDGHGQIRPSEEMPHFHPLHGAESSAPGGSFDRPSGGSVDEEVDPGGGSAARTRPGGTRL